MPFVYFIRERSVGELFVFIGKRACELVHVANEPELARDAVIGFIKDGAVVEEHDDVCKAIKLRRRFVEVSCLNSIMSGGFLSKPTRNKLSLLSHSDTMHDLFFFGFASSLPKHPPQTNRVHNIPASGS